MNRSIISLATIAVFLVIGGIAHAGQLTIPNSFTSGTTASASEMDANFTAVEAAVDDNDTRITANASAITGKVSDTGDTMTGNLYVPNVNITGNAYRYRSISPAGFRPFYSNYSNYMGDSYIYGTPLSNYQYYGANLNLPWGSTLRDVDIYTYDTSATGYVCFYVYKISLIASSMTTMTSGCGTGTGVPGNQTLLSGTITDAVIDSYNYSYAIRVLLYTDGSSIRLRGARVNYTVTGWYH